MSLIEAVLAREVLDSRGNPTIEVDAIPFALDPAAGVALSPQHGRDLGTLLSKQFQQGQPADVAEEVPVDDERPVRFGDATR